MLDANGVRELERVLDVLERVERHFTNRDEMEAEADMTHVRPRPLTAAVRSSIDAQRSCIDAVKDDLA